MKPAETQDPGAIAVALLPEPPPRRMRQILIGAVLCACALMLALLCIWVTVQRQQQRDRATDVAITLCDQVSGLGQRCQRDPANLPWAPESRTHVAGAPAAPALRPLPPRYQAPATTGSASADEEGATAQAAIPASDAAVTSVEVAGGRLVLTYADGSRVDAGPVAGDLLSVFRLPSPPPTPSRSPSAQPSPTAEDPVSTEPSPTPSGGPS